MKNNIGPKQLVYPTPVFVVSTYDPDGKPDAMTAAWGGICCSSPFCVTVSLREATYTYHNILEKQAFVINIPSEMYIKEADYFGMVSGKTVDKFAKTGLTPVKSEFVDAPYISEFPLNLECKLVQKNELGLHTQFIGEVVNVKIDAALQENKDLPIIEQLKPLIFAPDSRNYYSVGKSIASAFSAGKAYV